MAQQLVFDLSRAPGFDADDFLVSGTNEAAAAAIHDWPLWPSRALLVVGPPGSGKSHLAAIWAKHAGARVATGTTLVPAALWDEPGRSVVLEDCDRCRRNEADLFHALNLVNETAGWLLMTARHPPVGWEVRTPDLLSRLRQATYAEIGCADAETIKAVVVKLFADRQIAIEQDVVDFTARHCDQSLDAVARFVAAVDDAALSRGRRITRRLAAATLAALRDQGPT